MKLSSCHTVFNELDHIEIMLNYIYPIVDEIIILDNGSTDGTQDIIRNFPDEKAKIKLYIDAQNCPRYNAETGWDEPRRRNFTFSRASGDWIMVLDPDECFEPRFAKAVREMMKDERYDVYFFPTINFWNTIEIYRVGHPNWYPVPHARLWRNGLEIRYNNAHRHSGPVSQGGKSLWDAHRCKMSAIHLLHYKFVYGKFKGMGGKMPPDVPVEAYKGEHPTVIKDFLGLE